MIYNILLGHSVLNANYLNIVLCKIINKTLEFMIKQFKIMVE
jgi:hypothetical protein